VFSTVAAEEKEGGKHENKRLEFNGLEVIQNN